MADKFTPSSSQQANPSKALDVKDPWASNLRTVLDRAPLRRNPVAVKSKESSTIPSSSINKASTTIPSKQRSLWLKTVLNVQDVEVKVGTNTPGTPDMSQTTGKVLTSSIRQEEDLHDRQPTLPLQHLSYQPKSVPSVDFSTTQASSS
jgi:hypothetical protein